jgi:hypothetical protein
MLVALLGALLLAGGCMPQDLVGPEPPPPDGPGDDAGEDLDDGDVEPPPDPRFTFSISGSDVDPYLWEGPPAVGDYELYLWLVCSNVGLAHLQADFAVSGDALVPGAFFSPADSVVSIVWDEYGELNLAVRGCPEIPTLLGRVHLVGSGGGVRIVMERPSMEMGAVGCAEPTRVDGFSCNGYASYGGPPPQTGASDACAPPPGAWTVMFALSASPTDPNRQTAPPAQGEVQLWLWSLSGAFVAVQGDVHAVGGSVVDGGFAAEAPYLSMSIPGGPEVLLASEECITGTRLLGSLWVVDDGDGLWVTMTPGLGGGIADCSPEPHGYFYRCRPFSSRP